MKAMLNHSFVLDALDTTGADTFSHFEILIDEHRRFELEGGVGDHPSRLRQLVPTVGTFHTRLPLRQAFVAYNDKHKITQRRHICISFNEIRHILNLAQIMAIRPNAPDENMKDWDQDIVLPSDSALSDSPSTSEVAETCANAGPFSGPKMITFDGDQTLYSDGKNFENNPRLANYLYLLLKHGVTVAVVTAAGYEYHAEKYELRLSGLLTFFQEKGLSEADCERFYLFGGECNYLLQLGRDYKLHAVKEVGPGGWFTSTRYIPEAPGNWNNEEIVQLLDAAELSVTSSMRDQNLRATVIRKRRAIGLVPQPESAIPREALDESVLRVQNDLQQMNNGKGPNLPFCAFNGGRDIWVDVGNKRVGVKILQSYLGIPAVETLHIGDQFLNTGNDFAARDVCPCVWITSPDETTYILKSILRLAGLDRADLLTPNNIHQNGVTSNSGMNHEDAEKKKVDFGEIERRTKVMQIMDVYTGEVSQVADGPAM